MYEINLADIRTYLATLQPDERAGLTNSSSYCLVAKALDMKYSENKFLVNGTDFSTTDINEPYHPLPYEVEIVVEKFDNIRAQGMWWISRRQVEEAIPVLKGN
jgi:hypothetical protein